MLSARTRDSLGPLAVMFAVVLGVLLLYSRLAHAAGDPTPSLAGGASAGWDAFATNGPYWGGIVVAYVALQTFLSRQHWLAQGRLLAALTGLAMVGAAVVNWHFAGAPSAGIMTAAVAALALVWHPTVPGAKPGASSAAGAAAAALVVVLIGAAGAGLAVNPGCTSAQRANLRQDAKTAVVNCTGQALGATPALSIEALVAIANAVSAERLKCTPAGGSLDWSCVESDAIREGEVIGGCSLVQLLVSSIPTTSASSSLRAAATPDPGRAALDSFRARVAGGATYHTATGDY